ncbi:hypothetical protein QFZ76_010109 [Streptomyces sp. V4I2]|nr:hypothetical protein [Streptomyces sp. V4I2]
MSGQHDQQVPQEQSPGDRREFAKKGALAAIAGGCSGTAKAVWLYVLGDGA